MRMSSARIFLILCFPSSTPIVIGQTPNATTGPEQVVVVSLQDKGWGVGLDLPGFSIKQNGNMRDGRRYMLAENGNTNVIVSVTMEEAKVTSTIKPCKDSFEDRLKAAPSGNTDSRIWETGEKTFLQYTIPTANLPGQSPLPIQQRNLFVCLVHDGVFVDMHISKVQFKQDEQELFDQVVGSISFPPASQTAATPAAGGTASLDYFKTGSEFFFKGDYARAITPYEQALNLEKKNRQMRKNFWCVLIDNLGMAYGITGDLEKARQTFEYGIDQDPAYPLFYYNMACYYGEKRDAENAGRYLKLAYERKANVIPGEKIPDPRLDDSFTQLLKNSEFRKLVDSLVNDSK